MNCKNCGQKLDEGALFCTKCGTKVENQEIKKEDAVQNVAVTQAANQNTSKPKTNGLAIAGFVISIVSPICCCGTLSVLSLIFSIIGLSQINKNSEDGKGLAIAGIVISGVSILIWAILYFLGVTTSLINDAQSELPSSFINLM